MYIPNDDLLDVQELAQKLEDAIKNEVDQYDADVVVSAIICASLNSIVRYAGSLENFLAARRTIEKALKNIKEAYDAVGGG